MKKILIIAMLIITTILVAETYTVKQDGTGDFVTIQEACENETILEEGGEIYVFPGVYSSCVLVGADPNVSIQLIGTDVEQCIIDDGAYCFWIAPNNFNLLLKNLTFQNGNWAGVMINEGPGSVTIDNCIISNCGDGYGDEINPVSGVVCLGNLTIQNSLFIDNHNRWFNYDDRDYSLGGAIYIDYHDTSIDDGFVNIINNNFRGNKAAECGAIYATTNQHLKVENNYFEANGLIGNDEYPNDLHPYWDAIARFEDCYHIDFSRNICWQNLSFDYPSFPPQDQNGLVFKDCETVNIFNNTISQDISPYVDYGLLGIVIIDTDLSYNGDYVLINNSIYRNRKGIAVFYTYYNSLDINYNNVYHNPPSITGAGDYDYVDCDPDQYDLSTNPEYEYATFQPIWNSTTKSPCIDTGDPTILDDDGTPSDIGAVSAIDHRIDTISLPSPETDDGWKWLSFPALDVVLDEADIAGNVLDDILDPTILDWIDAQYYDIDFASGDWENDDQQFLRTEGFKFHMYNEATLDVPGFKAEDNTSITLLGGLEENYVGYWLEETQDVKDAFGDYWDDPSFQKITAQYWSAVRFINNEWLIKKKAGKDATLSYGEMVIIQCEDETSFRWDNSTPEDTKVIFSEPKQFDYEEQADYIPVFIEVDPTDPPLEIGAMVDSVCVGATVVEDTLTQINAYVSGIDPGDIELELYYGERAEPRRLSTYRCFSSSNPQLIENSISTSNMQPAYFITLKEDSDLIPDVFDFTAMNYPNPFNPSTTIAYSIPNDAPVNLVIYNIKGQKVKTLVNGEQQAGSYSTVWNGNDENGRKVSSGIYLYKLTAGKDTLIKKMMLIK